MLQILAIYPVPGPPQLNIFLPIPSKTTLAFSKSSLELEPTMNVKVAFYAPIIPPDIGVSQKIIFCCFARSLNSFDAIGEIVLESQIIVPYWALSNTPFFSHKTYATSLVLGSEVII